MSKPSLVYVLTEDQRQQQLIRRYLIRSGLGTHQMQSSPVPAGHGSGEQRVRANFARQVAAYRLRHARADTALLAIMDSDNSALHERLLSLDEALEKADVNPIQEGESIGRLIPKRNIESWIFNLNSEAVNEDEDYKSHRSPEQWSLLIRTASEALYKLTRPGVTLPDTLVPSLRHGIGELSRILSTRE